MSIGMQARHSGHCQNAGRPLLEHSMISPGARQVWQVGQ